MHGQAIEPHGEPFLAPLLRSAGIVRTLPAVRTGVAEDQLLPLSDGGHRLGFEFLAVDGRGVGAAPVEINTTIVVLEGVRIPEGEGLAERFKLVAHGVLRAVNLAGVPVRRGKNQPLSYLPHIRGIAEGRELPVFMPVPMEHIVGVVKPAGHGGKEIVATLEINKRGICSLPGGLLVIVLELIGDVQRIDQNSAHCEFHPFCILMAKRQIAYESCQ